MAATTIVIADDHPVLRQGLKSLLEAEKDFKVVGEGNDGVEAVQLCQSLQPNIAIVDLSMSKLNGLEVIRQVKKLSPETCVIILSMYGNEDYVVEALRLGAKAYLLKESTVEDMVLAVRQVSSGHNYLSAPLSDRALKVYIEKSARTAEDPYETLSPREQEVLQLVAEGWTNADIGKKLFLSRRTIEVHRRHMMHKLGLHNTSDLFRYAMRRGVLPSSL